MKIKEIIKLIKKRNSIANICTGGVQWLGTVNALYLIGGSDEAAGTETLLHMYDIKPEKQSEITQVEECDTIDLSDITEYETEAERIPFDIRYCGSWFIPYKTEEGILFMDEEYKKPLDLTGPSVHVRSRSDGTKYFAVKDGMLLVACIASTNIVSSALQADALEFYHQVQLAERNNA